MLYGAPIPRRRDAERNRAAIVAAASELLMAGAAAVMMPEIARRAGVGQATLYRHFRDRPAVVAAVVSYQLERLETFVAVNAGRPDTFRYLLGEVLRTQVAMRPLVHLIGGLDAQTRRRYQRRVVATLEEPLRQAQAAGLARPGLSPDDLAVLFAMLSGAVEAGASTERAIALLLDGVFVATG